MGLGPCIQKATGKETRESTWNTRPTKYCVSPPAEGTVGKYEFLQKKMLQPIWGPPRAMRKGSLRALDLDAAERLENIVSWKIKSG